LVWIFSGPKEADETWDIWTKLTVANFGEWGLYSVKGKVWALEVIKL
jgi:hypothetical protein